MGNKKMSGAPRRARGDRLMICAEVAQVLGISPQRVCQLERRALRKIRDGLKARGYGEEITDFLSAWLAGYWPGSWES